MAHDLEHPDAKYDAWADGPSAFVVRLESLFQAVAMATTKAAESNRAACVYSTPNVTFVVSTDVATEVAWHPIATVMPDGTVVTHVQREVPV